jgi:hypothetical protein
MQGDKRDRKVRHQKAIPLSGISDGDAGTLPRKYLSPLSALNGYRFAVE